MFLVRNAVFVPYIPCLNGLMGPAESSREMEPHNFFAALGPGHVFFPKHLRLQVFIKQPRLQLLLLSTLLKG